MVLTSHARCAAWKEHPLQIARLSAPRSISVIEQPVPSREQGEILIKVLACGICGSDLNAWRGVPGIAYPLANGAPGHEVWGEVARIDPHTPTSLQVGQRVTGLAHGGYAQYVVARAAELVAVPDALADAPVLGEPLACAANAVRRSSVETGTRVAFVGFGYLAALMARILFPLGGSWVAVSRRAESRDLALSLGAEAVVGFDAVPEAWWDSYPVVIEAAGVQQTLDYATWLTAYGGRLVIAGYHADGARTVNMQSWNWKGIDVVNAHERRPEAYLRGLREGLEAVQRHRLDLSRLISHRWPLSEAAEALRTAATRPPGYVKGVLQPWA